MITSKEEWLERHGFSKAGETWCICGDTFPIKDELRGRGCRFSVILRWHSPERLDLDSAFPQVKFNFSDLYIWDENRNEALLKDGAEKYAEKRLQSAIGADLIEYFDAAVGTRIYNKEAELISIRSFDSMYGRTNIYNFKIGNAILVWFTKVNLAFEKNTPVLLTGTIKGFEEFRGMKTTRVTRCIVKEAN